MKGLKKWTELLVAFVLVLGACVMVVSAQETMDRCYHIKSSEYTADYLELTAVGKTVEVKLVKDGKNYTHTVDTSAETDGRHNHSISVSDSNGHFVTVPTFSFCTENGNAYFETYHQTKIANDLLNNAYDPDNHRATGVNNALYSYNGTNWTGFTGKEVLAEIETQARTVTANCKTDAEKVMAISDWITANIAYNASPDYTGLAYENDANPFTVYQNRKGVCYGYAQLNQIMLQTVGVPCVMMRGYIFAGISGGSHVWNAVFVDGKWLYTDATSCTSMQDQSYLLMTPEYAAAHYWTSFTETMNGDLWSKFPIAETNNYCSVTLDACGGVVSQKASTTIPCMVGKTYGYYGYSVGGATTLGDMPEPVWTGHIFMGWYTDKTGGEKVTESTNVTKTRDHILYAHWANRMNTVTFHANGHGTAPSSQTVEYGKTATTPVAPVATGYQFDGWYKEAACINKWNFSTAITANTTLYAKWTANVRLGDVNDDGVVNSKDVIVLSRYLANWVDISIQEKNSDVNCDGVVNSKDVIILSRYLANWDVKLGE